jgi:hypothetical protein
MAGRQRCRAAGQSHSSGRSAAPYGATTFSRITGLARLNATARSAEPIGKRARGPPLAAHDQLLSGTVLGQRSAPSAQQATEVSAPRHHGLCRPSAGNGFG